MAYEGLYYPMYRPGIGSRPRLQSVHPFRHMVAAGTNMNGAWTGGGSGHSGHSGQSGHSGYGPESPEYDYHSGPPAHVPSGGSYSYHSTAGTGYGVPPPAQHPHPHPHPPAHPPPDGGGKNKGGGGGKKGSRNSSTLTALTLLSFFFFVNLLQGCIKDHMDYMNPTVMVMTTDIRRSSLNKMGDMNSREQNSGISSAGIISSNSGNLVMQPADMLASAALNSAAVAESMKPYVNLQSPYSGGVSKPPLEAIPQQSVPMAPQAPVVTQYQSHNGGPEVHYPRPAYDPNQPDVHDQSYQQNPYSAPAPAPQYNAPPQHYQRPVIQENPSINQQQPPIYMGKPTTDQHYHYEKPHNEYYAPSTAAPAPPPYSTPRNPFYEHQHPQAGSYSYKGNHHHIESSQYPSDYSNKYPHQNPYNKYPQKYDNDDTESQTPPHNQGPVPWSSLHSAASSSVLSSPIRRATIVSVSPTIKWVSVPSNANDHADFGTNEEVEEVRSNSRYSESSYYGKFQ